MQNKPDSSPSKPPRAGRQDGLGFVICGMEHTGTTLISDLFRQAPGVDAGFEIGVLLCLSPRQFPQLTPFAQNALSGWGLSEAALKQCCDTDSFGEFYRRLRAASSVVAADTKIIFDKTPRYIAVLDRVLAQSDVPLLVSYKDPRAIVFSDYKRAKAADFVRWYNEYLPAKLQYVDTCYRKWQSKRDDKRIYSLSLESLAMNARATMDAMFSHVGLEFRIDYALMDGLRYKNTRANFVSAEIAFEFRRHFTPLQQKRIETDFAGFDAWFYA